MKVDRKLMANVNEIPKDLAAEKMVLGSVMISEDTVFDVVEILKPSNFSDVKNQIIFETIVDLSASGSPIDAVTVADRLKTKGNLDKSGGLDYISGLTNGVDNPAGADYYAKIVKDKAALRELVTAGQKITKISFEQKGDADKIINQAQEILYNATDEITKSSVEKIGTNISDVLSELDPANKAQRTHGIMSGLDDLDKITNGFNPGRLIIIAARPAVGKSSLVLNFARHAALKEKKKVLMFSLEMSTEEILQRTFSAEANVSLTNIQRKEFISAQNWADIKKVGNQLSDAELYIDDGGNTINEISTKARRLKQTAGLDMIIVDYIGLISSSTRAENRQLEISEYSRRFKLLANELNIPVVLLAQLNRQVEMRPGKGQRPQLSDLRESGSLEQDADMVLFLYRDEKQSDDQDNPFGDAPGGEMNENVAIQAPMNQKPSGPDFIHPTKLEIAKHRNGATGIIDLVFMGDKTKFESAVKENR